MLNPSEVWRRAYYEGRECKVRLRDDRRMIDSGGYFDQPLCALGFLVEPYRDEMIKKRSLGSDKWRPRLAALYHVTEEYLHEAEDRYEGLEGYPRHSLLALAEWAEAQGH